MSYRRLLHIFICTTSNSNEKTAEDVGTLTLLFKYYVANFCAILKDNCRIRLEEKLNKFPRSAGPYNREK